MTAYILGRREEEGEGDRGKEKGKEIWERVRSPAQVHFHAFLYDLAMSHVGYDLDLVAQAAIANSSVSIWEPSH